MNINNLKIARLKKGYDQKKLSELLSISQQRYSSYETGKREPDNEMLLLLADVLSVDVNFLLGKFDTLKIPKLSASGTLKDILDAYQHVGLDGLTPDELDKVAIYTRFIKSLRKNDI